MDTPSVTASELKARCGRIIDSVENGREPVVITKRGRPVARIVPIDEPAERSLFGFARGSVVIVGDITEPIDVEWDATR